MSTSFRLWQLLSPTLPVGAFSYSQGLEQVVATGVVACEDDANDWFAGTLRHGVAKADLPVLLRVLRAWAARDAADVEQWSRRLIALRETSELRAGDVAMGAALGRLLASLGIDVPRCELPFAGAFGVAAAYWNVPERDACRGYAWSWCESQVAAAVKLVPLGHTAGQRLLIDLGDRIDAAVDDAFEVADDDIGFGMPGAAIASALHEIQYTRLFRS